MKPANQHRPEILPESASILLDIVRFTAALMVVLDHLSLQEFYLGYPSRQVLGDIAVPVFFVLSGFVIRFVTLTRESTAREYFIDRASRIYSVVLPSMLFTLAVGGAGYLLNRELFLKDWAVYFTHPFLRLAANLTFVSQAWGHNTIPFLNIPFWSLGYECVYYVLYGLIFFLSGWKRILLPIVLAAAIGPQVLFLFPVWWLGCWVYDLYVLVRGRRSASIALALSVLWLTAGLVLFDAGYKSLLLAPLTAFQTIATLKNPLAMLGLSAVRATMFALATGIFSAIALFLLLLAVDPLTISRTNRWARGFRRIADGTFTIYLMHYPFLALLLFLGLLRPGHDATTALVVTLMCATLILAAVPIDRFKIVIRRWLRAHI